MSDSDSDGLDVNPAFSFEVNAEPTKSWDYSFAIPHAERAKVQAQRALRDARLQIATKDSSDESDSEGEAGVAPDDNDSSMDETEKNAITPNVDKVKFSKIAFGDLNISKPLLKAIQQLQYEYATPIQAAVIPVALQGKDILASAVTGSGTFSPFCFFFGCLLLVLCLQFSCVRRQDGCVHAAAAGATAAPPAPQPSDAHPGSAPNTRARRAVCLHDAAAVRVHRRPRVSGGWRPADEAAGGRVAHTAGHCRCDAGPYCGSSAQLAQRVV